MGRLCERKWRLMRRRRVVTDHVQREWLAKNVRARRRALGLSMQEASDHAGIHLREWQKIEACATNATIDTLAKISSALGMDIVELMSKPSAGDGPSAARG